MGSAISSSGASVGSCARPRPQQYNMVARTTILVVFTIVLAATGVFVPEADRDLEESDGNRESLNSLDGFVDVSESGHLLNSRLKVKREAKKDESETKQKGKGNRASKNKKNNTKSVKDAEGKKKGSRNRKIKKANKKWGKGGNTNKSKKKRKHINKNKKVKTEKKGRKTGTRSKKGEKVNSLIIE